MAAGESGQQVWNFREVKGGVESDDVMFSAEECNADCGREEMRV